jgi:hypothetical protein
MGKEEKPGLTSKQKMCAQFCFQISPGVSDKLKTPGPTSF